ncbi:MULTISPECIES: alpha/beta fold hydrolase [unclassified Serratia (in: enterobacteria)]|uniref:alpha/beta fold hydrolase n=1 Tax=unclassified Serratia (in: enterobacteria) TaxID=2647522 RepID=UPI0004693099|nr:MULTISPECIES: alpha/beta hydrolase [unclassified Serratia (in: enterobacteria)]
MMSYNKRIFFTPLGRKLVYHSYTKKSSMATVLMLHGFSEHSFIWLKTVEEISQKLNCDFIIPDLSGHGLSDWREDGDYNISNYANDIEMIIDELNLHSLILVGHSMGGRIAQEITTRKLSYIKGIVLVDFCPGIDNTQPANCILENFNISTNRSWTIDEYKTFLSSTRPLIPESEMDWYARNLFEKGKKNFRLRVDPNIANYNIGKKTVNVNNKTYNHLLGVPISIIRGQYSSFIDESQAKKYLSNFKLASYFSVPKSGHGLIIENNRLFNMALYDSLVFVLESNRGYS